MNLEVEDPKEEEVAQVIEEADVSVKEEEIEVIVHP